MLEVTPIIKRLSLSFVHLEQFGLNIVNLALYVFLRLWLECWYWFFDWSLKNWHCMNLGRKRRDRLLDYYTRSQVV